MAMALFVGAGPAFAKTFEYRLSIRGLQATQEGSITVSTDALDFSGKLVGVSTQKTFSVTNNSLSAAAWKQLPSISGSSAFTLAGTTCGAKLAPHESCTVTVQFTAAHAEAVEGSLSFSIGGSKRVSLSGSGEGTSPLEITQEFTTLSPRQGDIASGAITLTNSNSTALNLGTLQFTNPRGQAYTGLAAQNCNGKTLQPGSNCSITVTLSGSNQGAPLPEGSTFGKLTIPVAGKTQEHIVSGTILARPYSLINGGSGYASGYSASLLCYNLNSAAYGGQLSQYACYSGAAAYYPETRTYCTECMLYLDGVSLSTRALSFGAVTIGEPKSLQVLVTNESDHKVDLALEPLTVTAGSAATLKQSTNCTSLDIGDSCVVQLDIEPTSVTSYSGRITLSSTAEGSPYYVRFAGNSVYKGSNVGELILPSVTYGAAPFALTAPASDSSGVWSFTSANNNIATVTDNIVTVKAGGSVTITATQAAQGPYGPETKTATLVVQAADAVLSPWAALSGKVDESLTLTPPESNGKGAWTYTSSDPAGAKVTGATVLPQKVGTYTITASQAATPSVKASSTTAVLTVAKGTPVVGVWAPLNTTTATPTFNLIYPTSSSNGAWSATSSNPAVATINNGVVTVTGQGTTTITGTQAATDNYVSATASMTMTVTAPVIGRTKLMWQFNGNTGANGTTSNTLSDTGITSSTVSGVSFLAGGVEGDFARFNNGSVQIYSPEFQLTNKYFTFEWWQKGSTSIPSFTFGTPGAYSAMASNGTGVYFSLTGSTWNNSFGIPSITANVWTHIAIVRDSVGMHIYKNGAKAASAPLADAYPLMTMPGNRLSFGFYTSNTTMDLDQVRLTIGEARYLGNFTPSTSLTAN